MARNYQTFGYIFGDKSKLDYELAYDRYGTPKLKEGFSFDKGYQDQEPAGKIPWTKRIGGAPRNGGRLTRGATPYYKIADQAPKPAPKPAAPAAPKPKAAPPPTKQDSFSQAAAALLKTAEATLAAANKPKEQEKMKIINSQSVGVDASPLQIGPAAPPPKTSGVDSFKRKKPTTNPMKILTANALNI
jgi:hypothetical protein